MRTVELGEVLADGGLRNGVSPSANGKVAGEVLTLSAVTGEAFDPTARKTAMFASEVPESQQVRSGLLMFSRGNGNANLVARAVIADCDMPGVAFPDTVIAGRLDESWYLPRAFTHLWSSNSVRKQIKAISHTTNGTFKINQTSLMRVRIPLPSLCEQRRIATILDHVDALRAKRRQVFLSLDALASSIFAEMFGDPDTWPDRWPMGTIGDMAVSVQYGTSAKAGDSGSWPVLRMGNLTDNGRLDLSDLKYMELDDEDIEKYSVRRGDMLFNRTNSKEKVGKAGVVETDQPLAFAGYLVRVRFKVSHRAEFVCAYLASRHGRAVRQRIAKLAVNQANINAAEMRRIPIALPPAELQSRFVERISAARAFAAGSNAAALDELFASLQHRAFSGTL